MFHSNLILDAIFFEVSANNWNKGIVTKKHNAGYKCWALMLAICFSDSGITWDLVKKTDRTLIFHLFVILEYYNVNLKSVNLKIPKNAEHWFNPFMTGAVII